MKVKLTLFVSSQGQSDWLNYPFKYRPDRLSVFSGVPQLIPIHFAERFRKAPQFISWQVALVHIEVRQAENQALVWQ